MRKVFASLLLIFWPALICRATLPVGQYVSTPFTKSALTGSWTVLQSVAYGGAGGCVSGTSCTFPIVATTAGSVRVVGFQETTNLTITSVTGGTWNLVPSSGCHTFNSGVGEFENDYDCAYDTAGAAGITSVTVNLSSSVSGDQTVYFFELMPPAGTTASFDTAGVSTFQSSCTTCTMAALTLTGGPDLIVH